MVANLAVVSLALSMASAGTSESELDADQILAKAIDVQRVHRENNPEAKFDYTLRVVSEKLDGDGEVEETEERLYRSDPIEGRPYERWVRKNGRDLTEKELEEEAKREQEFREDLAKDEADEDRIEFDEDLVSRYDAELEGVETLDGRPSYRIGFSPRQGDLPTDRRIDRVLNRATGTIWVDRETFEVARVRFELSEKVKLFWGLGGSISVMTGELDRRPVDLGSYWLMDRFDLLVEGRALFSSFHTHQSFTWQDYAPRAEPTENR